VVQGVIHREGQRPGFGQGDTGLGQGEQRGTGQSG
jgi:hypothetical protein